jgi:hypothetical protein
MVRELSTRAYLWVGDLLDRYERNEGTYEHSALELSVEWEHLAHQVAPVVASITGGGH